MRDLSVFSVFFWKLSVVRFSICTKSFIPQSARYTISEKSKISNAPASVAMDSAITNIAFARSVLFTKQRLQVLFWLCLVFQILGASVNCFMPSPAWSQRKRPSKTCSMAVAKTGGKVIASVEEYRTTVLESDRPVLVFFTAPWCGPCRLSVPVVKEVMKEFSSRLEVVEVCTDDLPEIAADANVVSIPTIQVYSEAEVMDTIVGCVAKSVLFSSVEKVLEDIAQKVGDVGK